MARTLGGLFPLLVTISVFASSAAGVWVQYCEHINFSGACVELVPNVNQCYNVPNHMNDKLSSYKVQNGYCDFFRHANCDDFLWTARNREHNDVSDPRHKDQVTSFRCTHSCCDPNRFFACNLACNLSCQPPPGRPIGVDPGCNLRCAQGCCPEGVQCGGQ
ncbi:hypothetical protein QBC34DRAFT_425955 [Podospora aff. communis PSN243]|uniref:Uncharacterized protein n=1 Tax=Podospora aff. communis PSN243 TaxID=3040156 RepID=A0AAV9GNE8_9PEZI|nr:hypothetical protein QBC34DRAFT_425955 [Podospora aff. communis PSN243]